MRPQPGIICMHRVLKQTRWNIDALNAQNASNGLKASAMGSEKIWMEAGVLSGTVWPDSLSRSVWPVRVGGRCFAIRLTKHRLLSRSVWPDVPSRSVWPDASSHTSGRTKFVICNDFDRWHCSLVDHYNTNNNGFKFRFGVERRHWGPLSPWN